MDAIWGRPKSLAGLAKGRHARVLLAGIQGLLFHALEKTLDSR
jgi:hypothetical protein